MSKLEVNILCDPGRIDADVRRANANTFEFIYTDEPHPHMINYDSTLEEFIGYYDRQRVVMSPSITDVLEELLAQHVRNNVAESARDAIIDGL